MDPSAAKLPSWSPYHYTFNNPLKYVDPDGEFGFLAALLIAAGSIVYDMITADPANAPGPNDATYEGRSDAQFAAEYATLVGGIVATKNALDSGGDEEQKPSSDAIKTGTKDGERAGKSFTQKGKQEVIDANKQKNSGQTVCEDCGRNTVPSQQSKGGVKPPGNETQVDHIHPKSKGGDGSPTNGQVLCRDCNKAKSNKTPEEHYKPK